MLSAARRVQLPSKSHHPRCSTRLDRRNKAGEKGQRRALLCRAGVRSGETTALPRVASAVLGGHGGLFCDRTDVGLFLHGLRPVYSHVPPWDSHKQPELARYPLSPSAKAFWSQPFDVAALQWFRWIGPARWVDVLAV